MRTDSTLSPKKRILSFCMLFSTRLLSRSSVTDTPECKTSSKVRTPYHPPRLPHDGRSVENVPPGVKSLRIVEYSIIWDEDPSSPPRPLGRILTDYSRRRQGKGLYPRPQSPVLLSWLRPQSRWMPAVALGPAPATSPRFPTQRTEMGGRKTTHKRALVQRIEVGYSICGSDPFRPSKDTLASSAHTNLIAARLHPNSCSTASPLSTKNYRKNSRTSCANRLWLVTPPCPRPS